ncbi:hypothetical protein [Vibrio nigripulchritudo]|uniref:hypothetical protein n=1 Tax=Vibrio nigripulchritudo TaxID=28173 RepID=UPI002492CF8B|nr:hypothetical protein [Vibrio nigripulchritudo]BDU45857.1 hypothetical protein TUMSATVNIG3_46550 [Vibrio nigripulchritudo]
MRVLVIVLLLITSAAHAQVSSNLYGKTLGEFFLVASTVFDKTIIVDPEVNGQVKVYRVQSAANFRDVFFSVMRAHNLTYVETDSVIRVAPRNQMKSGDIVTTKTFKLRHVSGKDIAPSIAKSLEVQSSTWKVQGVTHVDSILADTVLMITAPTSMLSNVSNLLSHIDTPQHQVKITAVILEHTTGDAKERTVDLSAGAGAVQVGFNGSPLSVTSALANFTSNSADLTAYVKWMEQNGQTQILSKPSFTVLNGRSGLISVGQEVPFLTGQYKQDGESSDKPFQTIERKDVGLLLNIKPVIGAEGDITLTINQELSRVDKSVEASDIVTSKRRISTTLKTKFGETIALAGMTSNEKQTLESKVPVLGDIPVLGLLFSSESETEKSKTLTVLLKIEKA